MKAIAVVLGIMFLSFIGLLAFSALVQPERGEITGTEIVLADPDEVHDPVRVGDPMPVGFRQLLPRDGIVPVYDPQFVSADEIGWDDEALVIGLEIDGDSRAYPVGFLNRREMVIDSVAGIPVLVTW